MKPFAFVFPGQGSQSVGMLDAWGDDPVVAQTLLEASDALRQDMGRLVKEGSKEELALTTNTQPVMLIAGVAAYRVWMAEVELRQLLWLDIRWVNTRPWWSAAHSRLRKPRRWCASEPRPCRTLYR